MARSRFMMPGLLTGLTLFFQPAPGMGGSQRCLNDVNSAITSAEILRQGNEDFALSVVASQNAAPVAWWNDVTEAIRKKAPDDLSKLYESTPAGEDDRASRMLLIAEDNGLTLPAALKPEADRARAIRDGLRKRELKPAGLLTPAQQKELAYLLALAGIRRSKLDRLYQRAKSKVGLNSAERTPVIRPLEAKTTLGDEARLALEKYNQAIENHAADPTQSYQTLIEQLFALYSERASQPVDEPWFEVDGVKLSLTDFVNKGIYRQTKLDPGNTWMTVGKLSPDTVQNPIMKGRLTRELWWNRSSGINPIGSTRISRNMKVAPDGTEQLVSVELIRKGQDGVWVPYLFEADENGKLNPATGPGARKTMLACFECHYRLSGILIGGISMPNYKPSPQWYINNIDFIKHQYHGMFQGLVEKK